MTDNTATLLKCVCVLICVRWLPLFPVVLKERCLKLKPLLAGSLSSASWETERCPVLTQSQNSESAECKGESLFLPPCSRLEIRLQWGCHIRKAPKPNFKLGAAFTPSVGFVFLASMSENVTSAAASHSKL